MPARFAAPIKCIGNPNAVYRADTSVKLKKGRRSAEDII